MKDLGFNQFFYSQRFFFSLSSLTSLFSAFFSLFVVTCECSWWFRGCASTVRGSKLVGEVMRHGGAELLVAVGGSCGAELLGFMGFYWVSDSWIYVGCDMGLNFVVVRFVGEDMLYGVTVGLAVGCG